MEETALALEGGLLATLHPRLRENTFHKLKWVKTSPNKIKTKRWEESTCEEEEWRVSPQIEYQPCRDSSLVQTLSWKLNCQSLWDSNLLDSVAFSSVGPYGTSGLPKSPSRADNVTQWTERLSPFTKSWVPLLIPHKLGVVVIHTCRSALRMRWRW